MRRPAAERRRNENLNKLRLIQRWLVVGTLSATGLLRAILSHALPGRAATESNPPRRLAKGAMTTTQQPPPASGRQPPASHSLRRAIGDIVGRGPHESPEHDPGVEANARLTASTGLLLVVMLAAEGVTLISIRGLLSWHIAIGLALIPPVTLKLGSTMWRFAHYYRGDKRYTASGPPHPLLRILGPLVAVSTVALLGTGVVLWLQGPGSSFGFWHRASFIVWVAFMAIHVLAHLTRAVRLARADVGHRPVRQVASPGPLLRQTTVLASMAAGVVLAVAARGAAGGLSQWTHHGHFFR